MSCDSVRRFWCPPVPGMSISYLPWERDTVEVWGSGPHAPQALIP